MSIAIITRTVARFFVDESASVLTEYAVVLAFLSLACTLGFEAVSNAAATDVSTDANNFSTTASSPP